MGRKRNQGKARKEAKAARQGAREMQKLYSCHAALRMGFPCAHGAVAGPTLSSISTDICFQFAIKFVRPFSRASKDSKDREISLWDWIQEARNSTWDEFVGVWKDSAKMETAMSYLLRDGVQSILERKHGDARDIATLIRYLEEYVAVELHQTQALYKCPKIRDVYYGDMHTLVKFFRHRIPCSCLDKKYEEVKSITKIGYCDNPQCKLPKRMTERSNTKYCSRCRCITYCSRECQVADWSRHKTTCDRNVTIIAEFEARQQNM